MKKIIIILVSIFMFFSCTSKSENNSFSEPQKNSESGKVIYTSFYPLYFITHSLVGNQAQIINLVPAGGEPHDYEPSLREISKMQKANAIVVNGLGMESYTKKLSDIIQSGSLLIISEQLPNLIQKENDTKTIDPHTWLSPKMYAEMANIIAKELEKKGFQNLDIGIKEKLQDLDKKYGKGLKDCIRNEIITSHEAFGYLARDYNFKQKAIFGIKPEEEPSNKDIAEIVELIKKEKIKYIFSESFVSQKFAQTIQNETGVQILSLHPLESLSQKEEKNGDTYINIMEKNLELLKKGLECK